jgi:hypothetical protein
MTMVDTDKVEAREDKSRHWLDKALRHSTMAALSDVG